MNSSEYSPNSKLRLKSMSFREKEGKNGWQALKITFVDQQNNLFSPMFFGPKTPKERVRINKVFKNLCEVLGRRYENIPYQHSFEEFVYRYVREMKGTFGTTLFAKTLPLEHNGKKLVRLGFEMPFFSLNPDLEYTEDELMYAQIVEEEFGSVEKKNTKDLIDEDDEIF